MRIDRDDYVKKCLTGTIHITCDGEELGDRNMDWHDAAIWTLSPDKDKEGWETDGGQSGYGLYPEVARHYATCINDHNRLLAKLEIAEKALKDVRDYMRLDENWKVATFIDEALKAIRE